MMAADVGDGLVVERDAVAACCRDGLEVLAGILDHQVHVDHAAAAMDHRRDRLQHDRPHRDRLDEVAVADVEVEDAALGPQQLVDLGAEVREVCAVERRLDLDRPDPVPPGHRSRSYDFNRAMKNPLVRSRCGSVSRNSGRVGWAYWGHSVAEGQRLEPGGVHDRFVLVRVQRAHRVDDRAAGPSCVLRPPAAARAGARAAGARASAGRGDARARRGRSTVRRRARGRSRSRRARERRP